MTRDVYIVSAVRTPVGSFLGALATTPAPVLGATVIKAAKSRAGVTDVDEVIMGNVLTAGLGQNPARQASVKAGCAHEVPATTINMLCGAGLKAVTLGYQAIRCGDSDVVVAGGQENMSLAPHAIHMRSGLKFGEGKLQDTMMIDGLTDAFKGIHMGITAENIAKRHNVTRAEQDEFAVLSHHKASAARKARKFEGEIVGVDTTVKRQTVTVTEDEFIRDDASVESSAKLRPAFLRTAEGTVTAANASGINDGAAAVVLMAGDKVTDEQTRLARVVAWAQAGVDPDYMGMGPVPAVRKAVARAGWTLDDVDLFELNEAFASQAVACTRELGIDATKVNVNGGSISIGHPIGASGARILVTLLHAMRARGAKRGVAALCIGGGMGIAVCVEAP